MSKLVVLASLTLAGCATGGLGNLDRDGATHAKVQFRTATADGARAMFPKAIDPALPNVDRLAYQVRARFGDAVTASVNLCVSATGRVTKVSLARESTFGAFDQALIRDIEGWQFDALPGPASLEVCNQATIAYRAPR